MKRSKRNSYDGHSFFLTLRKEKRSLAQSVLSAKPLRSYFCVKKNSLKEMRLTVCDRTDECAYFVPRTSK